MLNILFCILYLAASVFLMYRVDKELKFLYYTVFELPAYPALIGAIVFGFIAGILHFFDALTACCFHFHDFDVHVPESWEFSGCTFLCSVTGFIKFAEFLVATTSHLLMFYGDE